MKNAFKSPMKTAGILLSVVVLLAIANYLAGVLLFVSYRQSPLNAGLFTIQQAYFSYTDPTVLLRVKTFFLMSLLLCFGGTFAAFMSRRDRTVDKTLFGKARFATLKDISKEKLDGEKGVVLGKFKDRMLRLGGYEFVLLAAPTRTGKGVGFCVPNLLQFADSAVVLDIKGENYNLTSEFRRRYMGNEIIYFNPFSEHTHRWNPLSYVSADPNFRANDLMALATIIYPVNEKDPFWSDAAKNLFIGLGLLILETPELPPTIGEILRQGSGKGMAIDEYLKKVMQQREDSGRPLSHTCRDTLNRFLNSGEQALKGVHATFSASLTPWANAVIDKATSGDDFSLRDVRRKKMTIYLNIPAGEILQAAPIIKLFFSQLINENVKELPEHNPELKHQCLLLMDEFTAMGKVDIIAKGVGYMAGYNMRLAIVIQDKQQLEAVYGSEDAHNIISNMGAVIYFTPSQIGEAEEYSKMIGNDTVSTSSRQTPKGSLFGVKSEGGSPSTTEQYQSRAIMLPQELMQMSKDLELVVRSGMPVIKADKIRYYEDPYFNERFTAVPMHEVALGQDRRKVPIPAALPHGDWTDYKAAVETSDFYVKAFAAIPAPQSSEASPAPAESRPAAKPAPADGGVAFPPLPQGAMPFDELHALLRADAKDKEAVAPVAVARAYCDAIVTYWQHAELSLDEPLLVLDLWPGDGAFLWKLVLSLQARLNEPGKDWPSFRYVVCVDDEAQAVALAGHPALADAAEHGMFATLQRNEFLARTEPLSQVNPVVVLAERYFATLPHVLMDCGGGTASVAQVRARPGQAGSGSISLEADWRSFDPAQDGAGLSDLARSVLDAYTAAPESMQVRVPLEGLRMLDAIQRVAAGGFLLLAADRAVSQERAIRSGAFALPGSLTLPPQQQAANFHALTHALRPGAEWTVDAGSDGVPDLLLVMSPPKGTSGVLAKLAGRVAGVLQDTHAAAITAKSAASASQCLSALRQSDHDPQVLLSMYGALASLDWARADFPLGPWQRALEATWGLWLPSKDAYPMHQALSYLALQARHYGLAREVSLIGMAVCGDNLQDLSTLAVCGLHTGDHEAAEQYASQVLASVPADPTCLAVRAELAQREALLQAHHWFLPAEASEGSLRLQPLAPHHAQALWLQYRDIDVSMAFRLPAPASADGLAAWIDGATRDPHRLDCVVVHEDWGVIGIVGIGMTDNAGLFSFWIGADRQGQGHGAQSARLLQPMLEAAGIRQLFALVRPNNRRSLAALAALGYAPMAIAAQQPDNELRFLRLGNAAEADRPDARAALARVCAGHAPGLRFD
ncbi:MAG: GNAT family N-acetyltransferase [Burkholderiales bacterium]|nr:GNAT family N-acetyltransferase [Burkholderiales bacterium]